MTTPSIYRISEHPKAKVRQWMDGRLETISRLPLSTGEVSLLKMADRWKGGKILLVEHKTGVLVAAWKQLYPETEVHVHAMDAHEADLLMERLKKNDLDEHVTMHFTPELPQVEGGFDEVYLQGSRMLSGECTAHHLQQIHGILKVGGRCWLGTDKVHPSMISTMKRLYGSLTRQTSKEGQVCISKKSAGQVNLKEQRAIFTAKLPDDQILEIETRPGVFAHRKLDEGARALLSVVQCEDGESVLEMGCGCGVVGIGLKKMRPSLCLCVIDSHLRAVESTMSNAQRNGVSVDGHACGAKGWEGEERFDHFIGNPPYFGDHRISGLFIDTANRVLKSGGRLWLVAKSMDWNREYVESLGFSEIELSRRWGYDVLRATKT